jgi:hypothetical protein
MAPEQVTAPAGGVAAAVVVAEAVGMAVAVRVAVGDGSWARAIDPPPV